MPLNNIPVTAFTQDGETETTLAKALDDLATQEAITRAARRCTNCGKYQVHEDLKTVPTDDGGTERLCPDCWDGSTAKAIYQAQWRDAVVQMDEGNRMARHSIHLRQQFVLGIGALSLRPELFGSYSGHRWQWNFDAASV
jgi:hypothetical protein